MSTPSRPRSAAPAWPTSARLAGVLLLVVGGLNAAAGAVALVAGSTEVRTPVAIGLLGAGVLTVLLGWLVLRGNHVALYVALGIFEVLLIARLVTAGGNAGTLWVSLVVLVVLVGVLWVAAIQVRRLRRADPTS
ncbi:hypothetical protein [Salsipaludibacter albus]|uniref:hypothetical protein n=1 Tax=Salsipaludibacter albus TaxID=2849650 RepID=UPI001EE4C829|nr:hypothetical protein [Salsipaludibacter albus]MBY5164369.1 hypothetical protein [Salsipaludibacter albus]